MKKNLFTVVLVVMLTLVFGVQLVAAGGQSGSGQSAKKGNPQVALILKDHVTPAWRWMAAAGVNKGKELGLDVTEYTPLGSQDANEQMQLMENAIEKGVDAIIVAPIDSAGIVPAIEKAKNAGIPVFTTNTRAFVKNPTDVITYVGTENEAGGYRIAKHMISLFPPGRDINVVILDGVRTGQVTIDRIAGMERAMKEDSRVKLLDIQEGRFARAIAQGIMENFLVKHPKIDLVICLNDDMAQGVYNAAQAVNRLSEMLISGVDGTPEGIQMVIDRKITATIFQDLPGLGSKSVEAVKDYLAGKPVSPRIVAGGDIIIHSNAQPFLDALNKLR